MNSFFPSTSKMIPSLTNDASALMIGKCFPDLNTVFCMKVIDIPTNEMIYSLSLYTTIEHLFDICLTINSYFYNFARFQNQVENPSGTTFGRVLESRG